MFNYNDEIANRTVLYSNLQPIGCRYDRCREFNNYLIRLASAHCVPPGNIFKLLISDLLPGSTLKQAIQRGSFTSVKQNQEIIKGINILPDGNDLEKYLMVQDTLKKCLQQ